MSLVEPPVPLSETNELVFDSVGSVLIGDFVNGSSASSGVSIRQALVVIEGKSQRGGRYGGGFEISCSGAEFTYYPIGWHKIPETWINQIVSLSPQ
jgi:hypothetical protein